MQTGTYAGTARHAGDEITSFTTRDRFGDDEKDDDKVSTGPSRVAPLESGITRYDQQYDTPEPPGGQAQTEMTPVGSALGRRAPTFMTASNHEDEWDETAGQSAEDNEDIEATPKTLADVNRANRRYWRQPSFDPMRPLIPVADYRGVRSLHDMNRFNRSRPDAMRRRRP